ncbi:hypothetical protein BTO10_10480 [Vibrio chagasii]|uniref:Uncharacterized protein n=1 Tax=Vibrio chagasii TaxID=170679 RepID=A0A2S7VE62_9VIBR|nr:hypothetical protein BTO10_10480 [Vibrio chagasii]
MPAIVKPFLQKWEPVQSISTKGSITLAIFRSLVEKGQNTEATYFSARVESKMLMVPPIEK